MAGRPALTLDIDELSISSTVGDSFSVTENTFSKNELRITEHGVAVDGEGGRQFNQIDPDDLDFGETIGRGASSYVQKAYQRSTSKMFAIKVINMFDKSKRDQVISEIDTLFEADCDALVTFYGSFFRQGKISVILEYMDEGSLDYVIEKRGPIPEEVLANMTYQMLWGLSYLKHERRVHRDIKPQNILMNSKGEVKLTDFGISKELEGTLGQCLTFVGTFKYMSPERIETKPYDYSSDIWSLGLVLMECATGEYPYAESDTYIDMVQTILESDCPTLPSGEFSEEFLDFLSECIQKDPRRRLDSEILMGSPWMTNAGAVDIDSAQMNVLEWIEATNPSTGNSKLDDDEYEGKVATAKAQARRK